MRLQSKQEELIDLQLQALKREELRSAQPVPAQETLRRAVTTPLEKADIRVDLVPHGKDYRFVITNWGHGTARSVTFDAQPQPGRSSPLVQGDYDQKIPIPELGPGSRVPLWAALTFDTGTAFNARWSWINPDGSTEQRASLLAI